MPRLPRKACGGGKDAELALDVGCRHTHTPVACEINYESGFGDCRSVAST
jgi:hypothetical protein